MGSFWRHIGEIWQKHREQLAVLLGIFIAGCVPLIELIIYALDRRHYELEHIAWILALALCAILLYQFNQLWMNWDLSQKNSEIIGAAAKSTEDMRLALDKAREMLDQKDRATQHADESFERLQAERAIFDAKVLGAIRGLEGRKNINSEAVLDELFEATRGFLRQICDTAVNVIMDRKGTAANTYSASIKILLKDDSYESIIYSTSTPEFRKQHGRQEPDRYSSRNKFLKELTLGSALRIVVNDLETYLEAVSEDFLKPNRHALDHYTKLIMVPISGPAHNLPDAAKLFPLSANSTNKANKNAERKCIMMNGDLMLGTLQIDNKHTEFSEIYDVSILRELALVAYSAIQMYDAACDIVSAEVK
jgi:hypothetical protein